MGRNQMIYLHYFIGLLILSDPHIERKYGSDDLDGEKKVKKTDLKARQNHRKYIQTLRKMSPEQRLLKAFELSEFAKQLFIYGLRKRFPDLSPNAFKRLLMDRLEKCHNRNY